MDNMVIRDFLIGLCLKHHGFIRDVCVRVCVGYLFTLDVCPSVCLSL